MRSYFDTQLMLAESKGLVLRDYRQFWMGHKGDMEARYTTNKNRLSRDVVEDMRQSYAKSLEYLETEAAKTSEEKMRDSFRRQLLIVAGFKPEEVDLDSISQMGDEEFQAMVRQRLLGEMINNGVTQKVVKVEEVEDHLANGWEFVSALPNGRAIINCPDRDSRPRPEG